LETAASTGFFRLTGRAEGLRVGAVSAGVGSAFRTVSAGGHIGTIKAARTGCERGRPAAISAAVSAAFTLSGCSRHGAGSDSQRGKGRNDENLSHDRPPSRCVIAAGLSFPG
jgi:hypothetical protein